jgi:hypothetical protein
MATLTGLEPATSAVTGRHANQLRYRAMIRVRRGTRGDAFSIVPVTFAVIFT